MTELERKRFLMIHKAIHNPRVSGININYELLTIKTGKNGCRFVTWKGQGTFMAQNPKKDTSFGKLARQGRHVTWVMRQGGERWGLILDDKIHRE